VKKPFGMASIETKQKVKRRKKRNSDDRAWRYSGEDLDDEEFEEDDEPNVRKSKGISKSKKIDFEFEILNTISESVDLKKCLRKSKVKKMEGEEEEINADQKQKTFLCPTTETDRRKTNIDNNARSKGNSLCIYVLIFPLLLFLLCSFTIFILATILSLDNGGPIFVFSSSKEILSDPICTNNVTACTVPLFEASISLLKLKRGQWACYMENDFAIEETKLKALLFENKQYCGGDSNLFELSFQQWKECVHGNRTLILSREQSNGERIYFTESRKILPWKCKVKLLVSRLKWYVLFVMIAIPLLTAILKKIYSKGNLFVLLELLLNGLTFGLRFLFLLNENHQSNSLNTNRTTMTIRSALTMFL